VGRRMARPEIEQWRLNRSRDQQTAESEGDHHHGRGSENREGADAGLGERLANRNSALRIYQRSYRGRWTGEAGGVDQWARGRMAGRLRFGRPRARIDESCPRSRNLPARRNILAPNGAICRCRPGAMRRALASEAHADVKLLTYRPPRCLALSLLFLASRPTVCSAPAPFVPSLSSSRCFGPSGNRASSRGRATPHFRIRAYVQVGSSCEDWGPKAFGFEKRQDKVRVASWIEKE
jgi:hypothetical protein